MIFFDGYDPIIVGLWMGGQELSQLSFSESVCSQFSFTFFFTDKEFIGGL